jgi:hypothetical protein
MKRRDGKLEHGDRVEVYRNLHNNTFSVRLLGAADKWDTNRWRDVGKVVKHLDNWMSVYLQDVKFAVQPAGQAKVRREGKKNVHAFVRGTVVKAPDNKFGETFKDECTQIAQYNPYKFDTFVTQAWSKNPCAIYQASKVTLNQGTVYAAL